MIKKTIINASIWALVWALVFTLCLSILIIISAWWGKKIEELVAPPLYTHVNVVIVDIEENQHIDILITGIKNRGCVLINFAVEVNVHETIIRTDRIILLGPNGSSSRIEDEQIMVNSPFVKLVRIVPIGNVVTARITSRCHPFWESTQRLFFIEIPNTTAIR